MQGGFSDIRSKDKDSRSKERRVARFLNIEIGKLQGGFSDIRPKDKDSRYKERRVAAREGE